MVIRRLLRYLIPHRKDVTLAFSLLFLATMANVANPILIKIFLDDYLVPRNFPLQPLILLASGYVLLLIINAFLGYHQLLIFHKVALRVIQRLRIDVFGKVQKLNVQYFDTTPVGVVVSRITNDTEAIKELFVSVLATYVQNIVLIFTVLIAMFILDAKLALFSVIIVPLLLLLMNTYRKLSTKIYHRQRRMLAQINAKLNESIQGMNIIQVFRQESRLRQEFAAINQEHYQASLQSIKLNSLFLRPAIDLLYIITLIIVLSFFGYKSFNFPIQVGVVYVYVNYLKQFYEPVNHIMMGLSELQQSLVAAERVFELLDEKNEVQVKQGTDDPQIREGRTEFRNVTFAYDGVNPVLKDISFEAEPGQTVALVGHTGSGKSTITNLLMRFYPIEKGEILIDGVPLEKYAETELRRKIGLVLQEPFLFAGDIKHNISLHNPEITLKDVQEAADLVQARGFIEKLPGKFNAPLGERGATLSSGQRQLISFARAMAIQPKILILDEATASIDTQTEELIHIALKKMRQGRTTIAIAHRLSTIQDADLILVLHQGRIVERGTHQELLSLGGLYHKMYLLQQGVS